MGYWASMFGMRRGKFVLQGLFLISDPVDDSQFRWLIIQSAMRCSDLERSWLILVLLLLLLLVLALVLRLCVSTVVSTLFQFTWLARLGAEPRTSCHLVSPRLESDHLHLLMLEDGRQEARLSAGCTILSKMAALAVAQLLVKECLGWR